MLSHATAPRSLLRLTSSEARRQATKKPEPVNKMNRAALSRLIGSRLDQNRLTTAYSQNRIIMTKGSVGRRGLIRPDIMFHATRHHVVVKKSSVTSTGDPWSSGNPLNRPENKNSVKHVSTENTAESQEPMRCVRALRGRLWRTAARMEATSRYCSARITIWTGREPGPWCSRRRLCPRSGKDRQRRPVHNVRRYEGRPGYRSADILPGSSNPSGGPGCRRRAREPVHLGLRPSPRR